MPHKRKELKIKGPNLWYLMGLITSDGNLSSDGRHIDITAKDCDFLTALKMRLGLTNRVGVKNKGGTKQAYHIQFANRSFYDFLLSIGLMQNKSRVLGALKIPNQYFVDFLRGVIDGDGSMRMWTHPSNKKEQWSLRIYSGSGKFVEWLDGMIVSLIRVQGKIYKHGETVWVLKYGKMAAREIVRKCYYKDCFGLTRKIELAKKCDSSYIGWKQSKTVLKRNINAGMAELVYAADLKSAVP